ncbi:MAG: hypothetical protein NC038_05010 [Paludibacter sp.]|nr:hypothetical protein [Bacteroidales bacterium]MCM1068332.1 hypothetical protein [Prevotella sp.]MCM1354040.1 hypothetical protein [Bacteroides sp.]MCM1442118.1 hypothetical protein [Muribaculum sp.]MCM1481989.1 hypothetical protein [Paludibacter sp.]
MQHKFLLLLGGMALTAALYAQPRQQRVPAVKTPIDYVQPDGDTLSIRLHGDEWHSFRTTTDGYLIAQNKKGCYCYAKYNKSGIGKATCRQAHNADKRTACETKYIKKHIPNKLVITDNQ